MRTKTSARRASLRRLKILKELNGFFTEDPGRHCVGFGESEGRWFDDLRVVDLLGGFAGGGQESCR